MEKTYFIDHEGKSLGELPSLLTVSLEKEMEIALKGSSAKFKVVKWSYEQGKGLTVELREAGGSSHIGMLGG